MIDIFKNKASSKLLSLANEFSNMFSVNSIIKIEYKQDDVCFFKVVGNVYIDRSGKGPGIIRIPLVEYSQTGRLIENEELIQQYIADEDGLRWIIDKVSFNEMIEYQIKKTTATIYSHKRYIKSLSNQIETCQKDLRELKKALKENEDAEKRYKRI